MKSILTVLIPTYNSHTRFMKVVEAYKNDKRVKIIVSDDSDDYLEKKLIKSLCQKLKIFYMNGPKSSPVKNWNNLLENINTPYFLLNHHDDYPNNLKFIDELEKKRVSLIIMPCSSKIPGKNFHHMMSWQQSILTKVCLLFPNSSLNMILAPTAALVVNSKFRKINFDENLSWFVDAEWYCQLFLSAKIFNIKPYFFNKSRIISIQTEDSITMKLKKNLKQQIIKEKDYLNSKGHYPGFFINFIQNLILGFILIYTKIKQLLAKSFYF